MKNEYIIINKTAIQKRIEDCNKQISILCRVAHSQLGEDLEVTNIAIARLYAEKDTLNLLLSQSTPLIPEIEKHSIEFTKNLLNCTVSEAKSIDNIKEYHSKEYQLLLGELELNGKKIFEDYISNLKLDI